MRFEGQPLKGGKITFYHPHQPGRNVSAYIQPDGTYRILEVPYGQVKVTVVALPPKKKDRHGKGPAPAPLPAIPLKYTDPATTDLLCPVRHATQTCDIDLSS
ncbi:MAG: hypothetical protein RMJ56_08480 [Gemmataceae bacterium]|nr:hypothetical protein [Gemmata sp.]MDW8197621.1 hypothetical protein [Gemmataceae bacterium]